MIHNRVAKNAVKPSGQFRVVLEFTGTVDRLEKTILQHILRLGLATQALGEERPEGVALSVEFSGDAVDAGRHEWKISTQGIFATLKLKR